MASVLLKACKEKGDDRDMEVILRGVASLNDEISWFKTEASKWGIKLSSIVPQEPNQDYCRYHILTILSSYKSQVFLFSPFFSRDTICYWI